MTNGNKRPIALIILDGWGISPQKRGNAIELAHTPVYDEICAKYPRTSLVASGVRVGLPADAAGNAEVGHMSIGAGRIVQTDVSLVEKAIGSGAFFENEVLKSAFARARAANTAVHMMGLVSDGGVHSSSEFLFALLRMAKREGVSEVFVHCILDGRDVQPRTADIYVEALEIKMDDIGIGRIASLCGRFFAMDSSGNWERTARAYTMLVHAEGERSFDATSAVRASFLRGINDEFIAPIVIEKEPEIPVATVKNQDVVVFFNHRADAMRQLVRSLAVPDESAAKPKIEVVCLTEYDRSFHLPVAFGPEPERNVLAQVLEENGVENYRITETERFVHVTQLFNGGADSGHSHERHLFVAASNSESRESEPESQSFKITDRLLRGIESDGGGVFVVNLPATDLLAATGNLEKTIEAVQFVDTCLGGVLEKVREANGIALITSSHGNCEEMINPFTDEPDLSSTGNSVPFHYIDDQKPFAKLRDGGALEDVAPTILGILGIEKPVEMTGNDLRRF